MLRNMVAAWIDSGYDILNEVLSLNAQELHLFLLCLVDTYILNEVLSLNAQECGRP